MPSALIDLWHGAAALILLSVTWRSLDTGRSWHVSGGHVQRESEPRRYWTMVSLTLAAAIAGALLLWMRIATG